MGSIMIAAAGPATLSNQRCSMDLEWGQQDRMDRIDRQGRVD